MAVMDFTSLGNPLGSVTGNLSASNLGSGSIGPLTHAAVGVVIELWASDNQPWAVDVSVRGPAIPQYPTQFEVGGAGEREFLMFRLVPGSRIRLTRASGAAAPQQIHYSVVYFTGG